MLCVPCTTALMEWGSANISSVCSGGVVVVVGDAAARLRGSITPLRLSFAVDSLIACPTCGSVPLRL